MMNIKISIIVAFLVLIGNIFCMEKEIEIRDMIAQSMAAQDDVLRINRFSYLNLSLGAKWDKFDALRVKYLALEEQYAFLKAKHTKLAQKYAGTEMQDSTNIDYEEFSHDSNEAKWACCQRLIQDHKVISAAHDKRINEFARELAQKERENQLLKNQLQEKQLQLTFLGIVSELALLGKVIEK